MLLESLDSTATWSRPGQVTAPGRDPSFVAPAVAHKRVTTSAVGKSILDGEQAFDGVRILDGLAPLERARYFEHTLSSKLEVLNSWEGVVTQISYGEGYFTARLYDLTNSQNGVSEADFEIEDVSSNDRDLLRSGGIFRWMVGYRRHSFGQRERVSAIVFRRLPSWTAEDLKRAQDEGERLAASLVIE